MNPTMKKLVARLQDGLPISESPYSELSKEMGLSEQTVIGYLGRLRRSGLLKRIDFSFDTQRLGLVSTLVGCRISKENIAKAKKVIDGRLNISHNYLRRHRLNMWFTLSARSRAQLDSQVIDLGRELKAEEIVSLPTKKMFKLRFKFNA